MLSSGNMSHSIYTSPCNFIAIGSDMALSGCSGWDFTVAPDGRPGHSEQAIPLYLRVSSSISICSNYSTSLSLPSDYHKLAHCGGSHYTLAMWLVTSPFMLHVVAASRCVWQHVLCTEGQVCV